MTAKRIPIFLADSSLEILDIITEKHTQDVDLSLSGAVNLVTQLAGIIADNPLTLSGGELLYCCDICNGGAHMTEFKTPDSVSIRSALESMQFGLLDGLNKPGMSEKWEIDLDVLASKLQAMDEPELFALAFATRQFWSGKKAIGKKTINECGGYRAWAAQWIEGDEKTTI